MFSWKPFLRFVHRFAGFWFLLECLFSCSWRKPGKATKPTRSQVPFAQHSFEKGSLENGNISSENFVPYSPSTFMVEMGNLRDGMVFGQASAQLGEGQRNPFQGKCGGDSKPSSLVHHCPIPGSRDLTESLVLEDDVVFGLASLSSDGDNTSYGADSSDEFLSALESSRDFSIDESSPCWVKDVEAEWRTEVAAVMDAFRACKGIDDEPIFVLSKGRTRSSLDTIAVHKNQQIREIQNWRNYLGGDDDTSLTSEGGYGVDTSFQFP